MVAVHIRHIGLLVDTLAGTADVTGTVNAVVVEAAAAVGVLPVDSVGVVADAVDGVGTVNIRMASAVTFGLWDRYLPGLAQDMKAGFVNLVNAAAVGEFGTLGSALDPL